MPDREGQNEGSWCLYSNMLLAIHSIGLGACWLGEIINQRAQVESLLEVSSNFELLAVLAVGYPQAKGCTSSRKPLDEIVLKTF